MKDLLLEIKKNKS